MTEKRKPIMLALSTFRRSDHAVSRALELATEKSARLIIVYVVDINLARYFIGSDVVLGTRMRETCEDDMLGEHQEEGERAIKEIAHRAEDAGIEWAAHLAMGRFAIECLAIVREADPRVIVTTRSGRPEWVRKFFGSPVDELIQEAGCPIEER